MIKEIKKKDVHYRYGIPTKVTVIIDTREKIPLLFPETIMVTHPELTYRELPVVVGVERAKLEFGDYLLKEYPDQGVVERKASQMELFKNLNDSKDRIRQAKSFRKLASGCKYPYILVECSPARLLAKNLLIKQRELVVHRLSLAIAKYGLSAIFIPWQSRNPDTRRTLGTFIVHLMLSCVLQEKFDVPPVLLEEN